MNSLPRTNRLRLYNSLSRRLEAISPKDNEIKMYVCGPTVYDLTHVGNARTYLVFDLLHRYLKFALNCGVNFVQNITDVGHLIGDGDTGFDKLTKKAKIEGKTHQEIADYYLEQFQKDTQTLNLLPPTIQPRASEYIKQIINWIDRLIEKGVAYPTNQGNVYFSVKKFNDYGKLSGRNVSEIIAGSRIEPASDKHSVADFALWKSASDKTGALTWLSPWGEGYPGWHIECTVMSVYLLGETFDIHGSAIEHIFPHHENEIAQTEAITGKPMARFWIHSGMLNIGGSKMGKSLGNMISLRESLKTYSANETRLAFFYTHYRKPFDYTRKTMEQGIIFRRQLFTAYLESTTAENTDLEEEIYQALDDDLDTTTALTLWVKNADKLGRRQHERLMEIFGLVFTNPQKNNEIKQLIKEREEARKVRDYLTADNRKAELSAAGFEVVDKEDQTLYLPR